MLEGVEKDGALNWCFVQDPLVASALWMGGVR